MGILFPEYLGRHKFGIALFHRETQTASFLAHRKQSSLEEHFRFDDSSGSESWFLAYLVGPLGSPFGARWSLGLGRAAIHLLISPPLSLRATTDP